MSHQLNKTEIEKINTEIEQQYGVPEFFGKKDNLSIKEHDHLLFVVKDKQPTFFYREGKIVPTLKLLLERPLLKQVLVDMGAVKFVATGADVMRPGIKDLDHKIKKDEFVVVVDETHKKPICVAQATESGEEIFRLQKGKVLKNIHHVGDEIWKFEA